MPRPGAGCPEPAKKKVDDNYTSIVNDDSHIQQWAALIRYYLHTDTDQLTEDEFAKAWAQLYYVLDITGQLKKG